MLPRRIEWVVPHVTALWVAGTFLEHVHGFVRELPIGDRRDRDRQRRIDLNGFAFVPARERRPRSRSWRRPRRVGVVDALAIVGRG